MSKYRRPTVDTQFFSPWCRRQSKRAFTVGWAGEEDDEKGLDMVQLATDTLVGVQLKTVNRRANKKVRLEFYQSLNALVCTSLPRTAAEAAACGVCVIATDAKLVPDLIPEHLNASKLSGFVIDHDVNDIRWKLKYLAKMPMVARLMGDTARKVVQEWYASTK